MSARQSLRVALWQCEQQPLDVAGNIDRLREMALRAAGEGVDLLVCPEMFLTGYNISADAVRQFAEPADGPSSQAIAAVARSAGLAIIWGFAERDSQGDIFNAAQAVNAQGLRLGVYRKTHLYGALDRTRFSASDGNGPVFDLLGWQVGMLICYDVEFPEAVRKLALEGADLVVVPTANMQGFEAVPRVLLPARALENQLFVAYANCCGPEADLIYGGVSALAAPDGRLLSQAGSAATTLIVDLDLDMVKGTPRKCLIDRRPDTYGVLTATKCATPLEFRNAVSGR